MYSPLWWPRNRQPVKLRLCLHQNIAYFKVLTSKQIVNRGDGVSPKKWVDWFMVDYIYQSFILHLYRKLYINMNHLYIKTIQSKQSCTTTCHSCIIAISLKNNNNISVIYPIIPFYPSAKRPVGYCGNQCLSVCPSVHPHFPATQYLINTYLEKGDMLPNYASWVGQEAY